MSTNDTTPTTSRWWHIRPTDEELTTTGSFNEGTMYMVLGVTVAVVVALVLHSLGVFLPIGMAVGYPVSRYVAARVIKWHANR